MIRKNSGVLLSPRAMIMLESRLKSTAAPMPPGNDDDITVGVLHDLWRREHEYKHRCVKATRRRSSERPPQPR